MLHAAGLLAFITLATAFLRAAAPVVSNIRASQRAGSDLVDVYYDLSDPEGNSPLTNAPAAYEESYRRRRP